MKDIRSQLEDLIRLSHESARDGHARLNSLETQVLNEYDALVRHARDLAEKIASSQGMFFGELTAIAQLLGAAPVRRQDDPPPIPYRQTDRSLADARAYSQVPAQPMQLEPVNPVTQHPQQRYRAA